MIIALILIEIVAVCIVGAELWLGIAIMGAPGDHMVIEREKKPSLYWFVMAVHVLGLFAIPVLASLNQLLN